MQQHLDAHTNIINNQKQNSDQIKNGWFVKLAAVLKNESTLPTPMIYEPYLHDALGGEVQQDHLGAAGSGGGDKLALRKHPERAGCEGQQTTTEHGARARGRPGRQATVRVP